MEPSPVVPFVASQSFADLEVLAKKSVFSGIGIHDMPRLVDLLDQVALPPDTTVFAQGEGGDTMFVVLEGYAHVLRGGAEIARLGPGDHFGELALVGDHPRPSTVRTESVVRLARLSRSRFVLLAERHPSTALRFLGAVAASLGDSLTTSNDEVGRLLRERSLPRGSAVHVIASGRRTEVATGTAAGSLLPSSDAGSLVVAALLDKKAISLARPIVSNGVVEPLTTATWEGRRIFRRSVGLLFLEAARTVLPDIVLTLGERRGPVQLVTSSSAVSVEQAARIEQQMRTLAGSGVSLREEIWGPEEVRARLEEQGWHDAAALVPFYREEAVSVVACGSTVALGLGPVIPRASVLTGFSVSPRGVGLELGFGRELSAHASLAHRTSVFPSTLPATVAQPAVQSFADPFVMVRELGAWLRGMSVTSVGRFDAACVAGQVAEIIRVSEGFHEKHVGRIADQIASDRKVRVVAIAGPSSSGKTTFIKRLKVQLEVDGIVPVHLSLDDYYVDRERTPRDASGEWDFESVDALDRSLLVEQVGRLLSGKNVQVARYDFVGGKSLPSGGASLTLGERSVLLVEGLHALNPGVLEPACGQAAAFRVFVHPATALPFDRLSAVLPEDIRLLRRIVRDRHQRGYAAAESIARWPSVRRGEEKHVMPWVEHADAVFDSSLVYEPAVLRVYAERYLLEVPQSHPSYVTAHRLRQLVDRFVPIHADHVPATSLLREFVGGSGFDLV